MKRFLMILLILVLIFSAGCGITGTTTREVEISEKVVPQDLSSYFSGYEGCFIMFDRNKGEYVVYNAAKSSLKVSPCSTFKIVNSLIGLEAKVIKDENTVFEWDGTKYPIESWNKDHTLKTAVADSVVWYFQKLASQVGQEKMQEYIDKVGYGNRDISGGITKFWLQSTLKISPMEQIGILRKLYDYKLPFSKRNIDIVKNIITLSDKNGARLSGKTGGGLDPAGDKYINGWFIGYVEKNGNVYFFAANIGPDGRSGWNADGQKAKEITLKILEDKDII